MADEIRCPFCGTTEFDEWSKGYIAHDSNVNCVMAGIAMWPGSGENSDFSPPM